MGCYSGPEIINDGLVFYYDMSNTQKSWKGKPLTNYYGDISTSSSVRTPKTSHFWDGYKWLTSGGYTHPGIDGPTGVYLGLVYKHTSGSLSSTWSGNSYGFTLKNIESTIGNTYTQSVWVYVSSDSDLTYLKCLTEGSTTNNITVNGYNTEYNVSSKGTWQQLARSAVSDGNVRWLPIYPSKYGVIDGTFTGFYMWGAVQVEDGTTVNKYAGDNVSYSRSSTQSLLDLTGRNIITPVNLSYASGNFSFDGTDDYLDCGNNSALSSIGGTSSITVCGWVYYNSYGGGGQPYSVITAKGTPWTWLLENPSNKFRFRITAGGADVYVPDTSTHLLNTWYCVVGTYDGTSMKIYINGILKNTKSQTGVLGTNSITAKIGTYQGTNYNMNGQIPQVSIYNRALTAQEIQQNFNATRSRYGI